MKLVYFNGRGFAEVSRLILAFVNEDYEDFRYPLEVIDWKTHNMKKEEFDNDKASGKLKRSLNKLPYLEIDGNIIPQSKAIERFLARRFNLMGTNDIEAARIDGICEVVRDVKDMYQSVRRLPEDEKESGMTKWFGETLPNKLSDLEEILGDDSYSVGNQSSLADIILYALICQFFDNKDASSEATNNCPRLSSIINRIKNDSNIINWINTRPLTAF